MCPWDILAGDCHQDLSTDHVAEPRIFKSHETWADIAKGGKYIYVCRRPADALLSFYNFLPGYVHCRGVSLEAFADAIFTGLSHSGTIWPHLCGWIQAAHAHPDTILVMTYEDLKADTKRGIRRIARFLDIEDLDDELVEKVSKLTSFQYMKSHETQFDDHFVFDCVKERMGLAGCPHDTTKVFRGGNPSSKTRLPASVLALLDRRWDELVRPVLRVASYDSFVASVVHGSLRLPRKEDLTEDVFVLTAAIEWAKSQTLDPHAQSLGGKSSVGFSLQNEGSFGEAAAAICAKGLGAHETMHLFEKVMAPTFRSNAHPWDLAFDGSAPTVASIAAEWMMTAACQNLPSHAAASALAEAKRATLNWIAGLAGFPKDTASGTFVSGATFGTLSALHAARTWHRRRMQAKQNPRAAFSTLRRSRSLKVVSTSAARLSVQFVADMLDVEFLVIAEEASSTKALAEILASDDGEEVFAVVATAGDTNFGRVDDLEAISTLCGKFDKWLHVDGTYGLGALVAPSKRYLFAGIDRADSFVVDPHKLLFAPNDCCALLYRDGAYNMQAYASNMDDVAHTQCIPSRNGVHLSRSQRGFALWFSLAVYGTTRYAENVETVFDCCAEVVDFIRRCHGDLQLVLKPTLPIVVFRKVAMRNKPADILAWCQRKWDSGELYCQPTTFRGELVFRLCFVNPATDPKDVIRVLQDLVDHDTVAQSDATSDISVDSRGSQPQE